MAVHPLAGKPAPKSLLIDARALERAYLETKPDPSVPAQRVRFGTSGHRGTALDGSFNEAHVLCIAQAICEHRRAHGIGGPLFMGRDSHALSACAQRTALEVLAANGVETRIAPGDELTPTPAVSHAILAHNRGRASGFSDGIVVTPSHNPPGDGGFKYNPTNGGPADTDITAAIEARANELLEADCEGVHRFTYARARRASTTVTHDYVDAYVRDLGNVIDLEAVKAARLRLGVDPMGGASLHYWLQIAEMYELDVTIVNPIIDSTFSFMTVDHDGKIRMDCSSPYAMKRLDDMKDRFDIAFGADPDADRHGIVTPSAGLMPPNHFLAVAIDYLLTNRPKWPTQAGVGKTVVSSELIDRVVADRQRALWEVPVGFKWFAPGLHDGALCFGGEESAGASLLRIDGKTWTTDKDGLALGLLAAEITAHGGRDPGQYYDELVARLGEPHTTRVDVPASAAQRAAYARLDPKRIAATELAGSAITQTLTTAPGNGASIGGVKVVTKDGWFAARPSGTEDLCKLYVESWKSEDHLQTLVGEARALLERVLTP